MSSSSYSLGRSPSEKLKTPSKMAFSLKCKSLNAVGRKCDLRKFGYRDTNQIKPMSDVPRCKSKGSFFLSKLTLLSSSYGNSACSGLWLIELIKGLYRLISTKHFALFWDRNWNATPGDICTSSSCSCALESRPNSSTAPALVMRSLRTHRFPKTFPSKEYA